MRRFTVLGFTEAELGFVLAATFAAFGVAYTSEDSKAHASLTKSDSAYKAEKLKRETAEAALRSLRDSVRRKSNLTPPCYERGESKAAIAELTIVGSDRYVVQSDTLGFADVEARFAPQLARSAQLQCRFTVIARAQAGVDAPVHSAAMTRLKTKFYVDERQR
jgi:hypothetical protein